MNLEGARLARHAADDWTARTPEKPRFVAGAVGPLNVTLSLSPKVEDPAYRAVTFEQVRDAYAHQLTALREGGVDLFLIETVFDSLNAKAAILAASDVAPDVPLWLSFTAIDKSGRNLSGQTVEAFWVSVEHARPLLVGVNCSLGAAEMRPFVEDMAGIATTWVACYPNAGLPNEMGLHDERPEDTSRLLGEFAHEGLVNVVGGCCGTTPDHVRAIAAAVDGRRTARRPGGARRDPLQRPRAVRDHAGDELRDDRRAHERHRVGALPPADRGRRVPGGAQGRPRAGARRREPPRREHGRGPARRRPGDDDLPQPVATEPEVARLPIMVDSSRWSVLEAGPEVPPGQGRRELASMKEGEEAFLEQARTSAATARASS